MFSWTKGYYFGRRGLETKKLSLGKIITRIILSLMGSVAGLIILLMIFKSHLIYFPDKEIKLSPASIGWPFENLWLTTSLGVKINAWYLPGPPEAAVALLFHGNAQNLQILMGRIIMYHKLGYGVMAIDYDGFGLSQGSPSEQALYADAEAAWQFLISRGIKPESILIHGFSLGGGVASWLALEHKNLANPLILDSSFTNLKDAAKYNYPLIKIVLPLVLGNSYDTKKRLSQLNSSFLMIFHSPEDKTVPFDLALENFESYKGGPKDLIKLRGGHTDFPLNQDLYYQAIEQRFGMGGLGPDWLGKGKIEEIKSPITP
ncbi:MAG: alpha/beta hydrolase [Deltaproteobacteria bacterium]|jgi:fermentation-respiration switch protein FrsA (DUF1100 family)|nr:alpha/beta hydrolase [Deltaproteobacteria bacterium]